MSTQKNWQKVGTMELANRQKVDVYGVRDYGHAGIDYPQPEGLSMLVGELVVQVRIAAIHLDANVPMSEIIIGVEILDPENSFFVGSTYTSTQRIREYLAKPDLISNLANEAIRSFADINISYIDSMPPSSTLKANRDILEGIRYITNNNLAFSIIYNLQPEELRRLW